MKLRLSLVDVLCLVRDIRAKCVGQRLTNVYDVDGNKTFLFKLHTSGHEKVYLLMESGMRLHTLYADMDKRKIPSNFCMKLRKHLRSKRLTGCRQLGADRVVDFRFGSEEYECHVILELYKGGNVILTDKDFTILTLLRSYQDAEGRKVAVKETYTPAVRTLQQQQTEESDAVDLSRDDTTVAQQLISRLDREAQVVVSTRKEKKQRVLKSVLCAKGTGLEHFGPVLIEHALLRSGLDPHEIVGKDQFSGISEETATALVKELRELGATLRRLQSDPGPGYIIVKGGGEKADGQVTGKVLDWEEYNSGASRPAEVQNNESQQPKQFGEEYEFVEITPMLFAQHENVAYAQLPSFDKAAEQYFSRYEQYRREQRHQTALSAAQARIERVKKDQQERIEALQEEQEQLMKQAALVESNLEVVDHVIRVLNSSIQNGLPWETIYQTIIAEQRLGNPLALLISGCSLEDNEITVQLYDPDWDPGSKKKLRDSRQTDDSASPQEGEERLRQLKDLLPAPQETGDLGTTEPYANTVGTSNWNAQKGAVTLPAEAMVDVAIDITNTAAGNASLLYRRSKGSRIKAEKTEMAGTHALKNAEQRANEIIKEAETSLQRDEGRVARKRLWFEKFYWFITTEGLVVVAGRDAQQNEQLVRKYLRPQDAYIHADAHGSATCVLRNPSDNPRASEHLQLLQPSMEQAGAFAVNMSSQWNSGIPTSAWWVYAHQVSKTAPTGEYLSTGSFMIRGQKNMLPPVKMEMGMTVLFRVDDNCVANHLYDRGVRAELPPLSTEEESEDHDNINPDEKLGKALVADTATSASQTDSPIVESSLVEASTGAASSTSLSDITRNESQSTEKFENPLGGQGIGSGGKISAKVRKRAKKIEEEESLSQQEALKLALQREEERRRHRSTGDATDDKSTHGKDGASSIGTKSSKQNQNSRRTKKQQRRRKKYEEQDEEDRELAMYALGVKSLPQEDTQVGSAETASTITPAEVSITNPVDFSGIGEDYGSKSEVESIREVRQAQGELSSRLDPSEMASSSQRIGQMLQDKAKTDEDNEGSDSDDENLKTGSGGQTVLSIDGKEYSGEALALAALVGNPREDDVLLHAIAMVAPYSALQGPYKYKVKLVPGGQKKGKGGRGAVDALLRFAKEMGTKRETELIKSIPEPEVTQIMVGNVRIVSNAQVKGQNKQGKGKSGADKGEKKGSQKKKSKS
eukprot:gb/GECG01013376.1/.p1 GENE.gb/GECG01013376.1/~~gb/GECG01013376.1/.p1  ORF type:complete len:1207 (+),score=227.90 gb/GECG01013376.1/:1-3621(+)